MPLKLSEQLYAATLAGNRDEQERIKKLIDQRHQITLPAESDKWLFSPIFTNPKTPALKLFEIMNKTYKEEWYEWLPETMDRTVFLDFNTVINISSRQRLLALKSCMMSNLPWLDWNIFSNVILGLNGIEPNFVFVEDPAVSQTIKGLRIMEKVRPGEKFDEDVKKYVAMLCKSENLVMAPIELEGLCGKYVDEATLPENRSHKDAIRKRLVQVVKDRAVKDLTEDDLVDIQVRRLIRIMQATETPT